ncbi:MAG: T9SS type A sorting domain-containing protein [Saprospiraceae bacterium]|nr:T9SS type A sorting domain-containing protein [Saprospiraceae bacterium]
MDSDGDGIPDYWEKLKGLNPLIQDHNGTQLSSLITGVDGYTNLECYLNCLSDALVNGQSTSNCQINLDITSYVENQSSQIFNISYYPNPAQEILHITIPQPIVEKSQISILNSLGKILEKKWVENSSFNVDISAFESGIYFLKYTAEGKVILSRKVIVIK